MNICVGTGKNRVTNITLSEALPGRKFEHPTEASVVTQRWVVIQGKVIGKQVDVCSDQRAYALAFHPH